MGGRYVPLGNFPACLIWTVTMLPALTGHSAMQVPAIIRGDDVTNTIWKGCYNLINRANVAIKYINAITGADERVKTNGLGEVYFQKAFAYFMLVKAYGEIPLFDRAVTDGAGYNNPRRPIADVYAEIVRLLKRKPFPVFIRIRMRSIRQGMYVQEQLSDCSLKYMQPWLPVHFLQVRK